MKRSGIVGALAATVALSFTPSYATTYTAIYVASGLVSSGIVTSPEPSAFTTFPAGKTPASIRVVDGAGLKGFAVEVCQNVNTSNPACDVGDNKMAYCSTGQTRTITGFSRAYQTVVFVNPANATAHDPCPADGKTLTGTITFVAN